jgi:hypothetical protein
MTKRDKLRIACAVANMTIAGFAVKNNVTPAAVHHVLNGKKSKRLNLKIDRFIEDQFNSVGLKTGAKAAA